MTKRVPLGRSASGILIPPDGSRAYVALTGDNAVAVIDLEDARGSGPPEDRLWSRRDGLAPGQMRKRKRGEQAQHDANYQHIGRNA